MAGELHVGTLTGTVEIEDKTSSTLDRVVAKVDLAAQGFDHLGNSTLKQAEAFFTAEAAWHAAEKAGELLVDTLKDLSYEGAKVADVEENFDRLTAAGGRLGSTLVKELREGTHATITDLELMKTVNQDLTAGMNLTNQQFGVLTKGAFALAQATGTDVKSAMDTMNDAMLTGRTRALALLTGKIDLAAAEEKFARSLGKTAENLTAEGKIEAARQAILEAVGNATARLGEQTDGLDEKVDQARTTWKNFEEDLGKTIARSPVVLKAFDDIGQSLKDAFGDDKDALIKEIVKDVEAAVKVATVFVEGGIEIVKVMNDFKEVIIPIGVAVSTYVTAVALAKAGTIAWTYGVQLLKVESIALQTSLGGIALTAAAITAAFELGHWRPISDFFEKMALRIGGMSDAQADAAMKATRAATDQVEAAKKTTKALDETADAEDHLGDSTKDTAGFFQESKAEMAAAAAEAKKLADIDKEIANVGKDWHETLKGIDAELLKNIEHLNQNGISMGDLKIKYHLTDAEINAVNTDLKEQGKALDEANKKLKDHNDAIAKIGGLYTDWEKVAAQVPDVLKAMIIEDLKHGAALADLIAKYTQLTPLQVQSIVNSQKSAEATSKQAAAETDLRDSLGLTTAALIARAEAQDKANASQRSMGGSEDVTRANLLQNAKYWQIPDTVALEAAKRGFSFKEIVDAWRSGTINEWVPHGPRIPGFREGGVGDFGAGTLAVLHGKEAIIPLDKMDGAGGGHTINFYVNGTGRDVARTAGQEFMKILNTRRKYGRA